MNTAPVSLPAARALVLHLQALDTAPGAEPPPTRAALYALVERLGCIQIDTLQMVHRSHYLVPWSRLGRYDPADLDALAFDPADRRLFEYWKKAASLIPLAHYRYSLPQMRAYREQPRSSWREWIEREMTHEVLAHVRERLAAEGPLRASDFHYDGPRRQAWWDWKPAKAALEHLYNTGEAMIADRVNFQRAYDLRERVLPEWVDTSEPTPDEAHRFRIEQAARALGICEPAQVAEYAYLFRGVARPHIRALMREGVFVEVEAETVNGPAAMIVHRDNLGLLEQARDGALTPARTTFLSPFDSLFWAAGRDEQLWGFNQVLECYKREPDRIYGYFSLPILHRDRLVGRFDPKLDRKRGVLHIRALHLEPGVEPDEALVADTAAALRDFLAFHNARAVEIAEKGHADFRRKLLAALA